MNRLQDSLHTLMTQFFPVGVADIVGLWMVWLLLVAAGIGIVSGIVPAVRAAQLSVVDGLRRVV